jgi:hypothetical protein
LKQSIHVPLSWTVIDWHPDDTWKKTTLPSLADAGADIKNIDRSVYVIRLNGDYAIHYPKGESPVVYVGEGRFGSRINSHRKWAAELNELVGEYLFQICLATPRVKKNPDAYRDCEAVLLNRFGEKFRSAPLWNKQFESRLFPHHEYSLKSLDYALCKRSGAKYKWAIRPMRSSTFFSNYGKTHF